MRRLLDTSLLMLITASAQAETIHLYAAGSLRAASTEVARAFEADGGGQHKVETAFRAGPTSAKAPEGRSPYAWVMTSNQADIVLTYCTNALQTKAETPTLAVVTIGKTLNVGADYGLIALRNGPAAAADLVKYILAEEAQAIPLRRGFGPGNLAR